MLAFLALIIATGLFATLTLKAGRYYTKGLGVKDVKITREGASLKEIYLSEDDPQKAYRWALHAKEVRINKEKTFYEFSDYLLRLVSDKHGQIELRGPRGNYLREKKLFELIGEISIESMDGYTAKAKDVIFEEDKGIISSSEEFNVANNDLSLSGKGFLFDIKKGHFTIQKQIRATFKALRTKV